MTLRTGNVKTFLKEKNDLQCKVGRTQDIKGYLRVYYHNQILPQPGEVTNVSTMASATAISFTFSMFIL